MESDDHTLVVPRSDLFRCRTTPSSPPVYLVNREDRLASDLMYDLSQFSHQGHIAGGGGFLLGVGALNLPLRKRCQFVFIRQILGRPYKAGMEQGRTLKPRGPPKSTPPPPPPNPSLVHQARYHPQLYWYWYTIAAAASRLNRVFCAIKHAGTSDSLRVGIMWAHRAE